MVRDSKKESKAYKSVVTGKLNLKKGKFKKSKKKSSKKKKKVRDLESETGKNVEEKEDVKKRDVEKEQDKGNKVKGFKSDYAKALEELTASEKAFLERQRANETYHIKQLSTSTHRQRIEEYNTNLSNLSEHHDIPKVGPG